MILFILEVIELSTFRRKLNKNNKNKHKFLNKNIKTNIFKIQASNSIKCGYFCIGFIDFMLPGKALIYILVYFNPFQSN